MMKHLHKSSKPFAEKSQMTKNDSLAKISLNNIYSIVIIKIYNI